MLRKRIVPILIVGFAALLMAGTAWAAGYTDLSAQVLKIKLDSGETIVVVNPLSDIELGADTLISQVSK